MADDIDALVLDFVEWVAVHPRPYADVMDVWRTSCPRLTVWEDALDRGLVRRDHEPESGLVVSLTPQGSAWLASKGRRDGPDP